MNEAPQILLNDLQDGEQCYPSYKIRSRWSQDFSNGRKASPWSHTKGLPEGRLWNGTQWFRMLREPIGKVVDGVTNEFLDEEDMRCAALAQTYTLLDGEKYKGLNPADISVTVEFMQWEVWCQDWFSHWTWDIGLDDQQVLNSFQRFVDRMVCLNDIEPDSYDLMGAESRGRWYGRTTGEQGDEQVPAPCRCPMCKQRGVINIGH